MDNLALWIVFFVLQLAYSCFLVYLYVLQDELKSGETTTVQYSRSFNRLMPLDLAGHALITLYCVCMLSPVGIALTLVPTVIILRRWKLKQTRSDTVTALNTIDRESATVIVKAACHFACWAYCFYRMVRCAVGKSSKGRKANKGRQARRPVKRTPRPRRRH